MVINVDEINHQLEHLTFLDGHDMVVVHHFVNYAVYDW